MARGKLIVISAPSGCGKTTIAKAILSKHPAMLFSVSATTRPVRSGEVNGKDYFFLSRREFEDRIGTGDLTEWEEIYGNYYGTLKSEIHRALDNGYSMIFDVDVKGALSIRRNFPGRFRSYFYKTAEYGSTDEPADEPENREPGDSQAETGSRTDGIRSGCSF